MHGPMLALAALIAPALAAAAPLPPGIYTNEEEVYFDKEAKRAAAPWLGVTVAADGKVAFVDLFGKSVAAIPYKLVSSIEPFDRIRMTLADGRVTELRRARTATCWGAAPKAVKKADGSEDWAGARDLKLHDQGGRVSFGGGTTGAPEVVLRMRNVIWPSGPSRPSLVLYVHKPDAPDKAVSYSWADPGAKMIGINLRWMQASCTIDTTNEEKAK
ncbi:hypothetical protein [Sphingomonas sp. SUN039]|uniref:hypothetical protein n=1 Tax=Sphingomonas sp. SUN039 TaxID=2937787 RepID=UPI002164C99D|nr:hypothetical protein [Sphingomonas sp. SUN039]UVO54811.1 hypothetical protein M0209_12020 [Sphingomonas sp. SUN039]